MEKNRDKKMTINIHYSKELSCNRKGAFPYVSSSIEKVTCPHCLNLYYRKNIGKKLRAKG